MYLTMISLLSTEHSKDGTKMRGRGVFCLWEGGKRWRDCILLSDFSSVHRTDSRAGTETRWRGVFPLLGWGAKDGVIAYAC